MNNEDMRLEEEKKENIAFLKVRLKDDNLGFSGEAEWEALAEHIYVHRYLKGQLFFAVSTHWYYMLEKNPDVSPEDAAVDFAAYYGKGIASWISMSRAAAALRLQQYAV